MPYISFPSDDPMILHVGHYYDLGRQPSKWQAHQHAANNYINIIQTQTLTVPLLQFIPGSIFLRKHKNLISYTTPTMSGNDNPGNFANR